MESPTGIIPEELMYPQKKAAVIRFLQAQPFNGDYKQKLLQGWAVTVGLRPTKAEYTAVRSTGIDEQP
jgi:hypothetical protein